MALVVPLPVGGLASEFGSLTEDLRNLEAARSGVVISNPNPATYSLPITQLTPIAPPGWPDFDVSIGPNGALVGIGVQMLTPSSEANAGYNVVLQLNVDGTLLQPNSFEPSVQIQASGVGNIFFPSFGVTYVGPTFLPLGQHTIQLVISYGTSGQTAAFEFKQPFVFVKPI